MSPAQLSWVFWLLARYPHVMKKATLVSWYLIKTQTVLWLPCPSSAHLLPVIAFFFNFKLIVMPFFILIRLNEFGVKEIGCLWDWSSLNELSKSLVSCLILKDTPFLEFIIIFIISLVMATNSCCPLTVCCAKCLIWMISFHPLNSCGRVSTVNSFFTDGEIEVKHLNNTQMVNSKASIRTQVFSNYKTWSADLYFYFLVKIHKNNTRSLFIFEIL